MVRRAVTSREFRTLVGMKEGFFFERIFSLFDKNSDGQIVFTEFGLSHVPHAPGREDAV